MEKPEQERPDEDDTQALISLPNPAAADEGQQDAGLRDTEPMDEEDLALGKRRKRVQHSDDEEALPKKRQRTVEDE